MVGHLQTNKVKSAILLFDIIHSVDSLPLAEAISRRAPSRQPIFLEVNVSNEATKYGFALDDLAECFGAVSALPNVDVRGLMTVAPQARDPAEARPVFRGLRAAAEALKLNALSMGMTDDFEVAIEEGATHVRIGRAIFGERGQ
jgi:pyridoxal phosphate enzyme (YggS family)